MTDTLHLDSLPGRESNTNVASPIISKDAITSDVTYDARDSIIMLREEKQIILYGDAEVHYESYSLENADRITIFWDKNEAYAEYIPEWHKDEVLGDSVTVEDGDSSVVSKRNPLDKPGIPKFSDGNNTFEAKGMRYNFETKKGLVYDAVTKQDNLYVHGGKTKMVTEEYEDDTLETIYASNTLITTCDAEHPHFGIRSRKQKIVPGKEVIVGPSNIEIAGVPTPLWLPFGFYPITTSAKRGLILPTGYEYSPEFGFGLSNFGFYTPIADYADVKLLGEIYFRGRWGLNLISNYKKRYRYNGNFSVNYRSQNSDAQDAIASLNTTGLNLRWSHNQEAAAHPYQSFSANVNFSTNQYNRVFETDASSRTSNTSSSNISYRRSFPNSPFSLNGSVSINQNSNSRSVNMTLPRVNVNMRTTYPFLRKTVIGARRWYEDISLDYNSSVENNVFATDSTIFEAEPWQNVQAGVRHQVSSSAAYTVLKYFKISPRISYSESWHNAQVSRRFEENLEVDSVFDENGLFMALDTTSYGDRIVDTIRTFGRSHQMSFGMGLTTKLYGTWRRNEGWLQGLRHVMTPSISFSFTPDNTQSNMFDSYTYLDDEGNEVEETYRRFIIGPYQGPSLSTGNMSISYSINNLFEAKIKGAKDTAARDVVLVNNFGFRGSVDLNRDSLQFSPLSYSASATLIRNVMNITIGGSYDYYAINADGNRVNKFFWSEEKKPLRFLNFSTTINTGFSIGQAIEFLSGAKDDRKDRGRDEQAEYGTVFDNFRLRHLFTFRVGLEDDQTTKKGEIASNNLSLGGSIELTDKWRFGVGNIGYDFKNKNLTYPSFSVVRDLHCWELSMNWAPTTGQYEVNLIVRDSPLNFIKIPYKRNPQDVAF